MSMTFKEALEYIYKVVKCREQDKAKCNRCESCSYNFEFGKTHEAEKAIAQYYEEGRKPPEIIYCKDCKWYKASSSWNCKKYYYCARESITATVKTENDFCSKAERRTDE